MVYGYARVSTEEQNMDLQLDALKAAGCTKIFKEKVSGVAKERPELDKLLKQLQEGDTIIVWKLDRFGRSLKHLINSFEMFRNKGVKFKSIQDSIDTSSAFGRFIFNMTACFAEFERDINSERTSAGLAAARARGRNGGRPVDRSLKRQLQIKHAKDLYDNNTMPVKDICAKLDITRKTLHEWLKTDTPDVK